MLDPCENACRSVRGVPCYAQIMYELTNSEQDIAFSGQPSHAPIRHQHAAELARRYAAGVAETLAETLWPTRCAVCDMPGEVLCRACQLNLAYVDWWRACPRCGAPFGLVQCSECNTIMLAAQGRDHPPYDACASAVVYNDAAARIVRTWKDAGERRLVAVMANLMTPYVPPSWLADKPVVVSVPATAAALRRRGFDHGVDLAHELAIKLGLTTASLFARPRARDQRSLARHGRIANVEGRFALLPGIEAPASVLVVDDVCTTGSTLFAATDALRAGGAATVRCLTFARVW